jgi:hypothetical protein
MTQTTSRVLIAILSCHALRGYEQSLRDTWIKEIPEGVDHRFFLGLPNLDYVFSDEVFLSVGDAWYDITHKMVAVCAWALAHDYDYLFKCDLDTLVRPVGLLQSDFKAWDWVGGQNSFFASGGAGYTLSQRAMRAVIEHEIEPGPAEDVNTAHALLAQGIALHHDPRFLFAPGAVLSSDTITYHLSSVKGWSAKATPADMYASYNGTFKLPEQSTPAARAVRFRRTR